MNSDGNTFPQSTREFLAELSITPAQSRAWDREDAKEREKKKIIEATRFRRNRNAPPRPVALAVKPAKIPNALRRLNQWVGWRYRLVWRQDGASKWTKMPVECGGLPASTTDARTWANFESVIVEYESGKFDGIGFVTSRNDPFVLIDLDHARSLATGNIAPWATEILAAAYRERAYFELSPSGTGLHIIGEGPQSFKGRKGNLAEMYCEGRFFTITGGLRFNPRQRKIGKLDQTIDLVSARIGVSKPSGKPEKSKRASAPAVVGTRPYPAGMTDQQILRIAFKKRNGDKLKRLLAGDISDYDGDASRADMACASMLGFWFWLNPAAVERVMSNSKLARDKWDTKRGSLTFLQYTIRAALSGKEDYYGKPCRIPSLIELEKRCGGGGNGSD